MKNLFNLRHLLLIFGMTMGTTVVVGQEACTVERTDELIIIRIPKDSRLEFTTHYPNTDEALLCIPAAFTLPDGNIQGAYMVNGRMKNQYNRHSKVSIKGRSFTLAPQFTTDNGFQQMCLVRRHQAVHFRDNSHEIRRAICKESEQADAIIVESRKALTMNEFAQLLARTMVTAVYTDMGSYGYGWYHTKEGLNYLSSLYFYKRKKQTNWIVSRRSAPSSQ